MLRRNKTWFRACGEMEKGYGSSLFASYWWDSFSSSWPLSLKGVRERLIR